MVVAKVGNDEANDVARLSTGRLESRQARVTNAGIKQLRVREGSKRLLIQLAASLAPVH